MREAVWVVLGQVPVKWKQKLRLKPSLEFHWLSCFAKQRDKNNMETYCQAAEEVFDRFLGHFIGQVAQEGRVRRAAWQPGPVDVGFAGRARSCGQDGAVDGRCPVRVLLRVPRSRDWRVEHGYIKNSEQLDNTFLYRSIWVFFPGLDCHHVWCYESI